MHEALILGQIQVAESMLDGDSSVGQKQKKHIFFKTVIIARLCIGSIPVCLSRGSKVNRNLQQLQVI